MGLGVCEFVIFLGFEECPPSETLLSFFFGKLWGFGYVGLWDFFFFFLGWVLGLVNISVVDYVRATKVLVSGGEGDMGTESKACA